MVVWMESHCCDSISINPGEALLDYPQSPVSAPQSGSHCTQHQFYFDMAGGFWLNTFCTDTTAYFGIIDQPEFFE